VLAGDQRSQHQNKKAARKRLEQVLQAEKLKEQEQQLQENWQQQTEVERGNAVRTFQGADFKPRHSRSKSRENRTADKQAWKKYIEGY
jgi:peptide chain release factor